MTSEKEEYTIFNTENIRCFIINNTLSLEQQLYILNQIPKCKALSELIFIQNINNHNIQLIDNVLTTNTQITSLSIMGHNMQEKEGDSKIINMLSHINSIQKLHISSLTYYIPISNLLNIESLTELSLTECYIPDISELSNRLMTNTTLTYLSLKRNFLHNNDCINLAEMLRKNSTLTNLNLSDNNIDDFTPILKSLLFNSSLVSLDISEGVNSRLIKSCESKEVYYSLINNNTLNQLKINGCIFSVKFILKILERNTSLVSLTIYPLVINGKYIFTSISY